MLRMYQSHIVFHGVQPDYVLMVREGADNVNFSPQRLEVWPPQEYLHSQTLA